MLNIRSSLSVVVLILFVHAIALGQCNVQPEIKIRGDTNITVQDSIYRTLTPQFFGFNLELIEFQNSLWNTEGGSVESGVIKLLQRFPGAIYRYPGGTVANHFDWSAAIGPISARRSQQIVGYQEPKAVQFGPSEYLRFVKQTGGTAWYVLNLYGALNTPNTSQNLAKSAGNLAAFFDSERSKGMPAIYRWELGNELDRGSYSWPASKYASVATEVANAVKPFLHEAKLVSMSQDWAHTSTNTFGVDYNSYIAAALSQVTTEFASHLYYDGAPWGLPLPKLIKQLCKNLSSVQSASQNGSLWITEHGRAPLGTPADPGWKNNWPQTAGQAAAISAADMMISIAQTQQTNGAFIHSLHGTKGPWPLFHKRTDGVIYPSAVYWALVLLRETLLDKVLVSAISTLNDAKNGVGYDINAVVMTNNKRNQYSIWLINRGSTASTNKFLVPILAGKRLLIKAAILSSNDPKSNNYSEQYKVSPLRKEVYVDVNQFGEFEFVVPAYSVNALKIHNIE